MGRATRRRLRESNIRNGEGDSRILPLAAAGALASTVTFLICCLLVLLVWPAPSRVAAQGFPQALKETAEETVRALRSLTLPEFVGRVVARLREEGVPVRVEEGTKVVLEASEPAFARSSDAPSAVTQSSLQAFARALAWGMNCHVGPAEAACGGAPAMECEEGFAPFRFSGVEFRGHADAVPFRAPSPARNNETLSLQRARKAEAVVRACLATGAPAFSVTGAGDSEPRRRPGTDGRNRRVEIQFLP